MTIVGCHNSIQATYQKPSRAGAAINLALMAQHRSSHAKYLTMFFKSELRRREEDFLKSLDLQEAQAPMSQGKSDPKTNIAMIYRPSSLSSTTQLAGGGRQVLLQKIEKNEKSKLCKDEYPLQSITPNQIWPRSTRVFFGLVKCKKHRKKWLRYQVHSLVV